MRIAYVEMIIQCDTLDKKTGCSMFNINRRQTFGQRKTVKINCAIYSYSSSLSLKMF